MTEKSNQKESVQDSRSIQDKWSLKIQPASKSYDYGVSSSAEQPQHYGINSPTQLMAAIENLFSSQYLSVLSTQNQGAPYGNLVAFASADSLTRLIFVTPKATRKFSNIVSEPRVAMVIDNRSNNHIDFSRAIAVTATGRAQESTPTQRVRFLEIFLAKHPHLKEFAESPSCAVISIDVETYYCVYRFQNVMELHLNK